MGNQLRLRGIWNDLQSSLWFRPIVTTLLVIGLALGTTTLERSLPLPSVFAIDPDNARLVLSSIASSMLTVVALTFSIIMVALTLASQQFSPRILGNFVRDQASQNVLSIFIGTFIYSLLVMGRIDETANAPFIPILSVIIAILFALLGVGALIYFIDHISRTIRANYIMADISTQTIETMHQVFSELQRRDSQPAATVELASPPAAASAAVVSPQSGYIQAIDFDRLVRVAQEHDLFIQIERMVGDFVAEDSLLLRLWPDRGRSAALTEQMNEAFDIGPERTMFEDVLFGIRQLVDIALKAISPAVNDPTTAVNCIDALSNILIQAAQYPNPCSQHYDEAGAVRVIGRHVTFTALVDLAFDQIRHYARSEVTVTLHLLNALMEIARTTTDQQRLDLLWQHAGMISRGADRGIFEPLDRQKINDCLGLIAQQVGQQLTDVLLAIDESLLK